MITPSHIRSFLFSLTVLLLACGETTQNPETGAASNKQGSAYAPTYATGFTVSSFEGQYLISIKHPWDSAGVLAEYLLVPKGQEAPQHPSAQVIETPVSEFVLQSTTHIPLFRKLNALDAISGFAHTNYLRDSIALALVEAGKIKEVSGSEELDLEKIIELDPQLLMVYPFKNTAYDKFEESAIPLIYNCDYLEQHPLGRAEWLLLTGLLLEKEEEALQAFSAIAARYTALSEQARFGEERPKVLAGSLNGGVWYAPGGNSYIAQFIADAGGNYVWANESVAGSLELDFEVVYEQAMETPFWGFVNYSEQPYSLEQLALEDERFMDFYAFQDKGIFYCNSYESDYFGKAILEPDVILADLVAIFHPSVLPKHKAAYFKLLEASS